jgi:hypothetical protein
VAGERLLDNLEDFTPGEAMTDGKRGDDGFHAAPPVKLLQNRPGIVVSLLFSGEMTSAGDLFHEKGPQPRHLQKVTSNRLAEVCGREIPTMRREEKLRSIPAIVDPKSWTLV